MRPADANIIKNVILPTEHGASVMLGEALLAGLFIGASVKGFLPASGWLFIFLMSSPLKIAIKDISRDIFYPRTSAALWFCGSFGVFALAAFAMAYYWSGPSFLFVMLGVTPLAVVHLWAVVNDGKKELTAELSGALSLGAAAACIVLAAGHSLAQALTVWTVLAVRAMTSVIYVRERLRLNRGNISQSGLVIVVHIAGFAIFCLLTLLHFVKPLILIAGFLLVGRLYFMRQRFMISAKGLGLQELMTGIVIIVLMIFAF